MALHKALATAAAVAPAAHSLPKQIRKGCPRIALRSIAEAAAQGARLTQYFPSVSFPT
jgi:hypothetical protein